MNFKSRVMKHYYPHRQRVKKKTTLALKRKRISIVSRMVDYYGIDTVFNPQHNQINSIYKVIAKRVGCELKPRKKFLAHLSHGEIERKIIS